MLFKPSYLRYGCVDSTNNLAMQFAKKGAAEGTVITALMQTSGKGRRGRAWWDCIGKSLLMSIIVRPDIDHNRLYELSFAAGLAGVLVLEERLKLKPSFKWPNDIYIGNKKIGGVLIEAENSLQGSAVIIGIGINLNQSSFPDELENIATSAKIEGCLETNIDIMCEAIAEKFGILYNLCLDNKFCSEILPICREKLWGKGKLVIVDNESESICGVIKDIDEDGKLLLATDSDLISVYSADTICFNSDTKQQEEK
ncbi:MAG: biotin--[acetyl-CoA-carboxylase] ligase [Armatimonadota bacterium]